MRILIALLVTASCHTAATAADRPPNFIVLFADDQGWADIGVFGAQGFTTPHLDRMAAEGLRATSFYVTQGVCGASRASLLTGCYANRVSMLGAPHHKARHGLHPDEMTIAEVLKQKGYATGMAGKWHLGHLKPALPIHHGFDEYLGLPYSNDMWPNHPNVNNDYPPLPLIEGDETIETMPDQAQLTTRYTERAVKFIEKNKDRPFFFYVAYAMPHVPLFVSDKFKGKSEQGMYGDVIMEIDWSVGQILQALKDNGVDENTVVLYTSDNGPWLNYGNHAGSKGPLREGKGTEWEGGVREPCIIRWPGKIPAASVSDIPMMTIDILPTFAHLAGAPLPKLKIDGKNVWPIWAGEKGARSPHRAYYFYYGSMLHAVRQGRWKLHFPHPYRSYAFPPGNDGQPGPTATKNTGLELYDLESDIGESIDLAATYPKVVKRLSRLGEQMRQQLGDSSKTHKTKGSEIRPHMKHE
ncbi:MAG: sulfatase family protein [Planctomycetota bacterium]|jgi:arylsulfatase A-like enzyme